MVVPNVRRETLQNMLLKNIKHGSTIYTDNAVGYDKVCYNFVHEVVNHTKEYVHGRVHTNSMENFWSLLKRGLHGTYISVQPFHLFRYLDERCFTFNERHLDDLGRFELVLRMVAGRRLTYAQLTGR